MARAADTAITDLTNSGVWGPAVDGVTIPAAPSSLLAQGLVNNASVVLGAQTNDSFLFLSRTFTKGNVPQPNNFTDGALVHMSAVEYKTLLAAQSGGQLKRALELYPADSTWGGSIVNVQSLGRVQSDKMHCNARRRAAMLDAARPGSAYVYRFNYWYRSNAACSAVPNFHLGYLGAVHQDEVTFVMGQPNFMEAGSCCGKWGLSEGEEGCDKELKCTLCYDESLGSGYAAYFDQKEFGFARQIGSFWTNFASSRDPNLRGGASRGLEWPQGFVWPDIRTGGVVLDADVEGGGKVEVELYDQPEVCAFWDGQVAA